MTRRLASLRTVGLALLVLLGAASPSLATARAATALVVEFDAAKPEFPSAVTFSLKAVAAAPIERIELLYTAVGEETLNLVTPPFAGGRSVELAYRLDMVANYHPPGLDIAYRWRLTSVDGTVTETEERAFTWADARFDWERVGTEQVAVYAYNGDEDFNRRVLDSAQETIDRLQTEFGVERSEPIRIWVYDSREDFGGAQAPNSEAWIAGTSYPGLFLVLAVLPTNNPAEIGRVVPHEVSHQVLFQATENPFNYAPTWLDEGLAVLHQDSGNESFPDIVAAAAAEGRLFSVRALNSEFPYDPADAQLAYAQSFAIVRFIVDRFGEEALGNLIDALRDGVTYDQAAQRALGTDLDGVDRLWKESLGYAGDSPAGAGGTGDGRITSAPSPAGGLADGRLVMAFTALLAIVAWVTVMVRYQRKPTEDAGLP